MTKDSVQEDIRTIGLDLGDSKSSLCVMDATGRIVTEGTVTTARDALRMKFGSLPRARIILEACGQSNWIANLLEELGHEVHVTNPRQLALISRSVKKCDRNDARLLARIGRADLGLLQPTYRRGSAAIAARTVLNARRNLVQIRTRLINAVRAAAKGFSLKLPTCGSDSFMKCAKQKLSPELLKLLGPLVNTLTFPATADRELRRPDRASWEEGLPTDRALASHPRCRASDRVGVRRRDRRPRAFPPLARRGSLPGADAAQRPVGRQRPQAWDQQARRWRHTLALGERCHEHPAQASARLEPQALRARPAGQDTHAQAEGASAHRGRSQAGGADAPSLEDG